MDPAIAFVVSLIFILPIIFIVWVIARIFGLRRELAALEQSQSETLMRIQKRVGQLEEIITARLSSRQAAPEPRPPSPAPPPVPAAPAPPTPVTTIPPPVPLPPSRPLPLPIPVPRDVGPSVPPSFAKVPPPPIEEIRPRELRGPAAPRTPAQQVALPPPPPSAATPPKVVPTPPPRPEASREFLERLGAKPAQPAPPRKKFSWNDLEEKLGSNWLGKIGTAVIVIGAALGLKLYMHEISPAGKIALGFAFGLLLLGLGVYGERRERYQIVSRAVLGGAWAILYFTTYAMHNVRAVRILESEGLSFALLFAVAAIMVAHTLRYDSQLITGFAYILGFVTIGISYLSVGTLVASAALAASLAIILWRRRWYAIEPFAIAAVYLLHWRWLDQIYAAQGGVHKFPEFNASVALLTLYWLIWMTSYFLRGEEGGDQQALLAISFLLNAGGYLAVMHHQAFHPELRFWFLLGVGAVYLGLSPLARRIQRRTAFILTSTFGGALLAVATPYRYSGARLELLWLAEAEAFLIAGWRLAEKHLRRLGWAAAAALSVYVLFFDLAPRFEAWRPPDWHLSWMLFALAAAFFLDGHFAPRLLREDAGEIDSAASKAAQVIATSFLLAGFWVALPKMWIAVLWTIVGVALGMVSRRLADETLRWCGHAAAAAAVARLLVINLQETQPWHGISLRLVTVSISVAALYVASRLLEKAHPAEETPSSAGLDRFGGLPAAYTAAGTLLLAVLFWYEVANPSIGLSWGLLGLALVIAARLLADRPLLWQGFSLLALSFARICVVDLTSTVVWWHIHSRIITVSLLGAIYYGVALATPKKASTESVVPAPWMCEALTWGGTISIGALLWLEVTSAAISLAWGLFGLVLVETARGLKNRPLLWQGFGLLTLSFGRIFVADLNGTEYLGILPVRAVTVSLLALIYYVVAFGTPKQTMRPTDVAGQFAAGGLLELQPWMRALLLWFGAGAIASLVRFEVSPAWVAVGWCLLVVAAYLLGRRLEEPALRLQAYLLVLLVGARCAFENFYLTGPPGVRFPNLRTKPVSAAALILYFLLGVALREKKLRCAKLPSEAPHV